MTRMIRLLGMCRCRIIVKGWSVMYGACRLGVPREYFVAGMDAEVEQAVRAGIETLRGLGC